MSLQSNKNAQIASEVFVFMFNAVNTELKLPVAYYFVDKLNAESKGKLIERVIESLLECGVVLLSTTFDGTARRVVYVTTDISIKKYSSMHIS